MSSQGGMMICATGKEQEQRIKDDIIYKNLAREAEFKIDERQRKSLELYMIEEKLKQFNEDLKKIKSKNIEEFRDKKQTLDNFKYGLSNQELEPLANLQDLSGMKGVLEYNANSKMSQQLFKNLGNKTKEKLRSVIKKPANELIKSQVITNIQLKTLVPL